MGLGDGPKLVRELFRVAEEHAPSIVFIDELMLWVPNVTILILEVNVKFKEPCWSCSINWTDSIPEETSKLSWQPTELIPWILPLFDQEELIEKLSSHCQMRRPNEEFLTFTPVK